MSKKLKITETETETPDGFELSPYDAEVARQIELAERIMREDRDALRKLAE